MASLRGLAGILSASLQLLGYMDTFNSSLKVSMTPEAIQCITEIHARLREMHDIVQAGLLLLSDNDPTVIGS